MGGKRTGILAVARNECQAPGRTKPGGAGTAGEMGRPRKLSRAAPRNWYRLRCEGLPGTRAVRQSAPEGERPGERALAERESTKKERVPEATRSFTVWRWHPSAAPPAPLPGPDTPCLS